MVAAGRPDDSLLPMPLRSTVAEVLCLLLSLLLRLPLLSTRSLLQRLPQKRLSLLLQLLLPQSLPLQQQQRRPPWLFPRFHTYR